MKLKKITDLVRQYKPLLKGKEPYFSGIRALYKMQNSDMEFTYKGLIGHYGENVQFDHRNPIHMNLVFSACKKRDEIKQQGQQLTALVSPEAKGKIDARQVEHYIGKPDVNSKDYEPYMKKKIEDFSAKGLTLVDIMIKAFTPGGKDVVPLNVNEFADHMNKIMIEEGSSTRKVLNLVMTDKYISEFFGDKFIDYYKIRKEAHDRAEKVQPELDEQYIEGLKSKLMNDNDIKESIDNLIKGEVNGIFNDIKHIAEVTPEKLQTIKANILEQLKDKVIKTIDAKVQSLSHLKVDPGNLIEKTSEKAYNDITTKNEDGVSYFSATADSNISDALVNLYDKNVAEIQKTSASINSELNETTTELTSQSEDLAKITTELEEKPGDKDLEEKKKELERKIKEMSDKLEEKQSEANKAAEEEDKLTKDKKTEEEKGIEYKEHAERMWSKHGEVKFLVLDTAFVENIAVEEHELDGNLVSKIENILLNKFQAIKTDFVSNNIDEAYHEYKLHDVEVRIFIIEDIFSDTTVITSTDSNIIGQITQSLAE